MSHAITFERYRECVGFAMRQLMSRNQKALKFFIKAIVDKISLRHCCEIWNVRINFSKEIIPRQDLLEFEDHITMVFDKEIDAAFPKEGMSIVRVTTKDKQKFEKVKMPRDLE